MALHGTLGNLVNCHFYPGLSMHFDGNSDNHHFPSHKEGKLVDFMEYSRYFQEIYPSQGTQAMLTQRQRKV